MQKQTSIVVSLLIGILLLGLKFWAYSLTNSNAILTDALESIVNVFASAFALFSLSVAARPKDINHPYGHGKIEFFSSGFEGGLIFVAGLLAIYEAYQAFITPKNLENTGIGVSIIAFTLLVNGGYGFYLKQQGSKLKSITLRAEGEHLMSDGISSLFIVLGILIVKISNWIWIDTLLSVVLAILLLRSGYKLLRGAIAGLMDEVSPEIMTQLVEILNTERQNNWIDIHNVRVQQYGADLHIDAHLTLPYYLTLRETHQEVVGFENSLKVGFEREVEIFTHTDPCLPDCCSYCALESCPKRSFDFQESKHWTLERLTQNAKHF